MKIIYYNILFLLVILVLLIINYIYNTNNTTDITDTCDTTDTTDTCDTCDTNNKKHNLAILAIFKNETMNLDVWIKHYIWQGVDHFYLIDNGSDDNPHLILQKYIDQGIVTLYNLPQKHNQVGHYKYVYEKENLKENTKWLIMADLDEFWYCNSKNIKNELNHYEKYHVIYSNWKMFGNDNLDKHPDDIRISIVNREENLHVLTKWIIQTKYIDSDQLNIHVISNIEPTNSVNLSSIFKLNHYPIQSKEFFTKVKMTRGDVSSMNVEHIRDMKYFHDYNKNTTHEDTELKNLILN